MKTVDLHREHQDFHTNGRAPIIRPVARPGHRAAMAAPRHVVPGLRWHNAGFGLTAAEIEADLFYGRD